MLRLSRFLSVVLAAAVPASALVGFTPGDDPEAKATLGPLQAVTLSAVDFHPIVDEADFHNQGVYLTSDTPQLARIPFPAEVVVLTSVKIRVYDYHPSADLCVSLYRAEPGGVSNTLLAGACTSAMSTQDPQTVSIAAFTRIGRFHSAYLEAAFNATNSVNLRLYGATVFYRVVA